MAENKVTERTFKDDCKVIKLEAEYAGYTGDEKYAVITDLSSDELEALYSKELNRFRPYIILTREMGEVIREYHRNNEKFAKREARNMSVFITCSEEEEATIQSLSIEDEQSKLQAESAADEEKQRITELSRKALEKLPPCQREYLFLHLLEGKSFGVIAKEKGIRKNNVQRTYQRAVKNYIEAVKALEVEV